MTQNYTPLRIPEAMTAREIGAYMRGLREHFKLSLQDVSERLHIRVRYVQALEEGRTEALPGKVYARGYVHTYAEFLGLDADQVVGQWFAAEPQAPVPSFSPHPAAAPSPLTVVRRHWKSMGIAGLVALVALLLMTQIATRVEDNHQEAPVAPKVAAVPEEMLARVRTRLMPTPQNYECLMSKALLRCFYAHRTMQMMMEMDAHDRAVLGDEPAAEEAPEEAPND